jgi:hypothetical protein
MQNTALRSTSSNHSISTTTMPINPNSSSKTDGIAGPVGELSTSNVVSRSVNPVMLVPLDVTIQFAKSSEAAMI